MVRKTKEEANRTRQQIIEAARAVFHRCGVGGSTLEKVAQAAGVTRGAVYWHFRDKAELFFAMREDVFAPIKERTDSILFSDCFADPLDAIEASLKEFFRVLDECPTMREVFEIMALRCEYVGDFATVQAEVARPSHEFLEKVERAYQAAAAKGCLRPGLDAAAAARDTWAFATGLLHLQLGGGDAGRLAAAIPGMISAHIGLRRPG